MRPNTLFYIHVECSFYCRMSYKPTRRTNRCVKPVYNRLTTHTNGAGRKLRPAVDLPVVGHGKLTGGGRSRCLRIGPPQPAKQNPDSQRADSCGHGESLDPKTQRIRRLSAQSSERGAVTSEVTVAAGKWSIFVRHDLCLLSANNSCFK